MPPPSSPIPGDSSTDQIVRSLGEIRESIAERVEQLSLAVDRLRIQTGLVHTGPSSPSIATSRRITSMPPGRAITRWPNFSSTSVPPINVPSSSSSSPLTPTSPPEQRPVTDEEIRLLLDRAARSPVSVPAPENQFQDTLDRLRSTRQRIREMQQRNHLDNFDTQSLPPISQMLLEEPGEHFNDWSDPLEASLLAGQTAQNSRSRLRRQRMANNGTAAVGTARVYANEEDALAAANDFLSSIRADPLRVPTRRELDELGPGMENIDPDIIESLVRERFISAHSRNQNRAFRPTRTHGLKPTNVERLRKAPTPEIVRSTPASPASTIVPDISPPAGSGASTPNPGTETLRRNSASQQLSEFSPRVDSPLPSVTRPMTFSSPGIMFSVPDPAPRRRGPVDDRLTYRGVEVTSRLHDTTGDTPPPPATRAHRWRHAADEEADRLSSIIMRAHETPASGGPIIATAIRQNPIGSEIMASIPPAIIAAEERLNAARMRMAELQRQHDRQESRIQSLVEEQRSLQRALSDQGAGRGTISSSGEGYILRSEGLPSLREPVVLDVSDVVRNLQEESSPARPDSGVGRGPRDERPEEVDTIVRIRQLQADTAEDRQRHRDRLQEIRQAADDVYQTRRSSGTPIVRPLDEMAREASPGESIFDVTRRALQSNLSSAAGVERARNDPLVVTVSTGQWILHDGVPANDQGDDGAVVDSLRRQFDSLDTEGDRSGVVIVEMTGGDGQVLEAVGEGSNAMESTMARLARAIVDSFEGSESSPATDTATAAAGVLEGTGQAEQVTAASEMSREASAGAEKQEEDDKYEPKASKGAQGDLVDSIPLQADDWPHTPQISSRRATRPYISMLNL